MVECNNKEDRSCVCEGGGGGGGICQVLTFTDSIVFQLTVYVYTWHVLYEEQ